MKNSKLYRNNKTSNNSMNKQASNEWDDPEDVIYAKKKHQSHRVRNKEQKNRIMDESERY